MTAQTKHFLRHYLEMLAAMVAGMLVLGGAIHALVPDYPPALMPVEMATTMSIGMVVWMRHRRHGWAATLEMVAVMVAPFVLLTPAYWAGLVPGDVLMLVTHAAMLPLMALAMLRRSGEYTGHVR